MSNTIAQNLARLQTARTNIATAITTKGGTVASGAGLEDFPTAIGTIPSGGGPTVVEKDVNFYDYDGTLLYAYTFAEAEALTELPANPTHTGLTAQGWNWSLVGVKNCAVTKCKLDVGQMYTTDDGALHYIVYAAESVGFQYYANNGTGTVDWGDGTTPYSIEGASTTGYSNAITHHYGTPGKHTIKVTMTAGIIAPRLLNCEVLEMHFGSRNVLCTMQYPTLTAVAMPNSIIFYNGNMPNESLGGDNVKFLCFASNVNIHLGSLTSGSGVVERISIGENTVMYGYNNTYGAFRSWSRLKYLHGVVYPIQALCSNCANLREVSFYFSTTVIGEEAFYGTGLHSVSLPSMLNYINANAFANCYSLQEIKFGSATPPTVSNANAFSNLPTDCTIYVPSGHLSDYTSASNYPDPNTYTYVEY